MIGFCNSAANLARHDERLAGPWTRILVLNDGIGRRYRQPPHLSHGFPGQSEQRTDFVPLLIETV